MTEAAKYKPGDLVAVETVSYGTCDGVVREVQGMNGHVIYLVAGIYPPLKTEAFWVWDHQMTNRAYDQPPNTADDAAYYDALTEAADV